MDHFSRLKRQIKRYLIAILLISLLLLGASHLVLKHFLSNESLVLLILFAEACAVALVAAAKATNYATEPLKFLWQAIVHVSPESGNTPAPNFNEAKVARELITSLCLQVYQLASNSTKASHPSGAIDLRSQAITANLPIPLLVLDKAQAVIFANERAHKYLGVGPNELIGKNIYNVFDLAFPNKDTFDSWLEQSKTSNVTSSHSWEHVRLRQVGTNQLLQFDMAAYYNKSNPAGVETIITLFDRTTSYGKEDNSINYTSLAVHELRTPLTLLRGYIEVFEDELSGKLTPELNGFLVKMQASAQQLAAFVNNILNIAKVEEDQLYLSLKEEDINSLVTSVVNDLKTRASAGGKVIETQLATNLPSVGADHVSLYEVIANLLDNALKYSGDSQKIIVKTTVAENNMVEVTVQDFGVGIAETAIPHLFERFYRSYHTQKQVGGTGLGLYLSKAIVGAHGGNIWVRSKEGEGTTVGFTVKPYTELAAELKNSDNKEIVRVAYGWIKNHSLTRR